MRRDETFPVVRRGYDRRRVDDHLQVAADEIERLATENRELRRQRETTTSSRTERNRLLADIERARGELERLTAARTDAERDLADLLRTRDEVQRELSTFGDVLRRWVADSGRGSVTSMLEG